ncbi:MAG: 50S ribosomal protein L25 [Elusimicrobiales bacterium]|nr:50S ribosomal protein L25 [Elusimicrobiales bacterium]
MEKFILNAFLRENAGVRSTLRELRSKGIVPAVVYGGDFKPVNISVSLKEFISLIKKAGNSVITLKYGDKEDMVVVKDIQKHVVTDQIIHVDFNRVAMDKKIDIKVPLKFIGEPYGVKTQGGIAEYDIREVTVRCYPKDIPHEIQIDISNLRIGDSIRIKDIKQDRFEIRENPENIVVSIIATKEESISATQQSQTQPEVIGKGKKEESKEEKKEEKK